jgi:allantoicase
MTDLSDPFTAMPDLASRLLGGAAVARNDEFFAAADNLVEPAAPVHNPKTFGAKGQVYDGWETRRRREPGHDWAIVRLGAPGVIRGVVIDTAWFTGNYPPHASLEAANVDGYPAADELAEADWVEVVPRSSLTGNSRHLFRVSSADRFTHVRLNIYPDGGVARLRVHGEAVPDPRSLQIRGFVDLAALANGGLVVGCSNMFYGTPNNLLLPGLARTMGEGWETARRRDDGNDWVMVRLGLPGTVRAVELDTSQFKGNAPGWASLTGYDADGGSFELLPRTRLQPDTPHRFAVAEHAGPPTTQVRLDIYPDGGMARLRLLGDPASR